MTTDQNGVNNNMARIMIVDDHPTVREGLGYRISSQPDMTICGDASDVGEAMKAAPEAVPSGAHGSNRIGQSPI